ncbi:putative ribonuclease H-like domain-containing protein [Tanacetum coccineum]|uniref:Ribonuclease H-like domain-containing protein n=1 Tax=Tanacetum coccineum TaxID=301880 RepID=A0ABQ5G0X5_9ASTR
MFGLSSVIKHSIKDSEDEKVLGLRSIPYASISSLDSKSIIIALGSSPHYSLWDVRENGNSFKPAAQTTTNAEGSSTTLIPGPVIADEKTQKKNGVMARSMLLMAHPNEQLLTFNQYKDAKILFAAIQTRFCGNDATKKTQKTLLKQMNKPDLDTMSFDDLYNNFKIIEQEVKGTASSSSSSQNLAFMSSTSSTNKVNTAYRVSTDNTQVSPDSTKIHEDNLEEMDLKWQLALLSMRTRSYMADDEVPTNMALMAFSDSEFNKSEFNLATYKRGLTSVEEQLVFYKKNELEKLKQEKESNQLIEKFNNASKSLGKLIVSQIPDKSRKCLGFVIYNAIPPPPTRLFSPPNLDLSNSGLEEFQQPEFEGYGPKTSKSVSEDSSNEANCNYHQRERMVSGNNYTRVNYNYSAKKAHPSAHKNIVPRAVLTKSGLRPLNTARPVNTVHPKTTVYSAIPMLCFSKLAQSTVKRPKEVNIARPNTTVVNVVRENQVNAVKSSACWVWRPTKLNSASITFKRHNYVDARGNMSYLSDFKEFDRGYVTFGEGAKRGRITGTKESIGAGHSIEETWSSKDYILMPLWKDGSPFDSSSKDTSNDEPQPSNDAGKKDDEGGIDDQERTKKHSLNINIVSPTVSTAPIESTYANFFGDESKLDLSNISTTYPVPTTPNTRIHKDHSLDHVLGDVQSGVQTRRMINKQGFISAVYEGKTHEDLYTCLFTYFLSQEEPKKVIQALKYPSWIEAMQEELLQFKLQQVWTLVDLPYGKRAIGTKWVYKNKKEERGIVIRNKARLVAQCYTHEEGIDYDEVFAPLARIEAIRLFLAHASFKDFVVYQMDVNSAFLYGKIKEKVYVYQPLGFEDLEFPDKVYKVEKALYGLHQAPRAWYETLSTYLLDNGFQRGRIDKTLFIKRIKASRPDIMFAVCACARFQVTPKVLHLHAVKRIFRYLKDYGYNFMNTKIFIDNESTIFIVKNPVFHSKTKYIEIRHHFIRDSYENRLIQVIKIHTDHNVADLLTKALDVTELPQTSEPIPNVPDEAVYEEWDDKVERATTTTASLDVKQASGGSPRIDGFMYNIVQESGELGGRLEANKEDDEDDLEDSSKQGRMIEEVDQDTGVTLVSPTHSQEDQPEDQLGVFSAAKVLADATKENVHTYTRSRRAVSTGCGGISSTSRLFSTAEEIVSTAGASMPVSTAGMVQQVNLSIPSPVVIKDKAPMRLQEELDEEERQRMSRVHEAAPYFTEEEWENIRARVEADEELTHRLQAYERIKAELDHEGSKRQKTNEASGSVQEQPEEEEKELSKEDLQ